MADLTTTLSIVQRPDGFWLFDKTRGMNLSMHAPSEQAAFVESLEYYQRRLSQVEKEYRELRKKVEAFVEELTGEEDCLP